MAEVEKYQAMYAASRRSTMDQIGRSAFEEERPHELAPASFIIWEQLRRMAAEVRGCSGGTLVDLGCGSGGSGLWVASQARMSVIGSDTSEAACVAARHRASADFSEVAAEFRVADMAATGLADASVDAVMSIDAVQIAPDRGAVFGEAARVLRPGGRIVLTTFDHSPAMPLEAETRGREIVLDSASLLNRAGFEVVVNEQLSDWPDRGLRLYRGILAERDAVAAEVGPAMVEEAIWGIANAHYMRRVFLVGLRK